MIDINQFVGKWNGQHCEADGSQPGSATYDQCVDIIKQWEKENDWIPLTHGNAIDYWNNGESGYTKVENNSSDLNQFPPAGALVVFQIGKYGHIGIALPGTNGRHLVIFQQNYPTAGWPNHPGSACNVQTFDYLHPKCVGWLIKN